MIPEAIMWLSDVQRIGVGLTAFGVLFMALGVILLFDSGFIAVGNIFFLMGLTCLIGIHRTVLFFSRKEKIAGTAFFFVGILLVILRWPLIGMLLESIGISNLFGEFFPVVLTFARKTPVVGMIFNIPIVGRYADKTTNSRIPV